MILPYRISKEALSDLEKIWLYTYKNWSEEQADKYYNDLVKGVEFISNNVKIGKKIDYIKQGYRYLKIQSHLIFYRIDQEKEVSIIRVLHQSMDIRSHLEK